MTAYTHPFSAKQKHWKLSQLEQRLMLAADAGVAAEISVSSTMANSASKLAVANMGESDVSAGGAVVFIDARVNDWNALASGIDDSATMVLINSDQDAIEVITSTLQRLNQPAQSVHLVCHGDSGQLHVGRETIDTDTLIQSQSSLQQWANHVRADGDVLVYGCDVASGQTGQAFIQTLAQLTHLNVAASTDVTGTVQHSDWDLEYTVGNIESALFFDSSVRDGYRGTLNIVINAWGQTGEEQFNLRINHEVVATYDAATTWTPFEYQTNQSLSGDRVQIEFINDAYDPANNRDRNLFVNNIQINGQNYETNDSDTFSSGTWRPEDGVTPGFGRGIILHSNGYFQYGSSDNSGSTIVINARGDEGDEQFVLKAGTREFDPVSVSDQFQAYEFQLDTVLSPGDVRIEFVNDLYDPDFGIDRNLSIDNIVIDGESYETESPDVFSLGVWESSAGRLTSGNLQVETLNGSGYFQFSSDPIDQGVFALDTAYADNGLRTLGTGGPRAEAFRAPDGTIAVVNGEFRRGDDGISRLTNDLEMTLANGDPDTSYGPNGRVKITPMIDSFSDSSEFRFTSIDDVAVDSQGRVVVIGQTDFGSGIFSFRESFIIRITADGQLDTSFVANGYDTVGFDSTHDQLAIDGSDRVILAGQSVWTRLDASGNLDQSFGTSGNLSFGLNIGLDQPELEELIVFDDGSTLSLWNDPYSDTGNSAALVKLDANGNADAAFGNQGVANVPTTPNGSEFAGNFYSELQLDDQGRIVIAGDEVIRRFTTNGQVDTSFGGGVVDLPSFVIDSGTQREVEITGLAIDSQDRILVSNFFSSLIGRVNADGTLDTTLSEDGFQLIPNDSGERYETLFVEASDRLVTVGEDLDRGRIRFFRFI
ncbi:DUF4347 domain-containing protein [Planctomycetes bacterium K23_9]|uniref:DUF4347 domain-containing protein n=1 Tax=Stieleria marina TaxID=1930275 RepID=A0A517NM66_9BACT|nr:hypothetical protein K239x_01600 [Planctomycetes bacterium K23_9]